ncbi:restriction endonuclease subunit S [Streptomyces decoyicus]|uniref:restriction endonuclease subunit S n=1 Tax=Streptomyces decoyicus TaxID=249567 RepID=UPI00362EA114
MSDWHECRLGDLIRVHHGYAFSGDQMTDELTGAPIVVSIGNFSYTGGFRFGSTRVREFRGNYPKEFELNAGELLVIMTCQTAGGEILGVPAFVPNDGRVYLHNQRIGRIECDELRLSKRFAYYLFLSSDVNRQLFNTSSGTKILHTSPSRINEVRVTVPRLHEQRNIAEVLGALDDKIAVNERIAATARELGLTFYSQSLHDDDSVEVAVESVTTALTRGVAPKYTDSSDELTVLNQKCIRDGRVNLEPSRLTLREKVKAPKLLQLNDVLVNSTGVGTLGRVARWTRDLDATVDSHITIVRFNEDKVDPVCGGFAMLRAQPEIEAMGEGSTGQTELRRSQVGELELTLPSPAGQKELRPKLDALEERADQALRESLALAALRDTLLPQLMSGKLRVQDAEKIVEDAV